MQLFIRIIRRKSSYLQVIKKRWELKEKNEELDVRISLACVVVNVMK